MLSVSEAVQKLLGYFSPLKPEPINFNSSLGRILAEDVVANQPNPLFDNSSMDGFAVIANDLLAASPHTPIPLNIIEDIPAGKTPQHTIRPGTAAKIMTGAQVPEGADAVIPVEDSNHHPNIPADTTTVQLFQPIQPGDNIRIKGENFLPGAPLISAGTIIRPQEVALFASLGITQVKVYKKPKIGLLVTGDELLSPDKAPAPSKIRDSNSYMLQSLLQKLPVEIINSGIIEDSEKKISLALNQFIKKGVDLIITTGGVSMGTYDFVRKVIEKEGRLEFWKVNIKPGKPLAFGYLRDTPIIGLPGNPVSSFVGYHVFIIPIIKQMSGIEYRSNYLTQAALLSPIAPNTREQYIPAQFSKSPTPSVQPANNQGSGNLFSLVQSNSLIILPSGVEFFNKGDIVNIWLPNYDNL